MSDNKTITIKLDNFDTENGNTNFTIYYSGNLTFDEVKAILTEAFSDAVEKSAQLEFIEEFEGEARLNMPVIGLFDNIEFDSVENEEA